MVRNLGYIYLPLKYYIKLFYWHHFNKLKKLRSKLYEMIYKKKKSVF